MNRPFFSIIIPVYNAENTLDQAILSIINQNFKSLEVILINDGSNDQSKEKIYYYASKDNRILYINKSNGGVSSARNSGLLKAKGKYILFLDSDDFYLGEVFEHLSKYLIENNNIDMVFFGYSTNNKKIKLADTKNKCYEISDFKHYFKYFLDNDLINQPWNKVYRTKIIQENKILFREGLHIGEDLLFNLSYIDRIDSIGYIDACFVKYNVSDTGLVGKFRIDLFDYLKENDKHMKSYIEKWGIMDLGFIRYFEEREIHIKLVQILEYYKKDCSLSREQIYMRIKNIRLLELDNDKFSNISFNYYFFRKLLLIKNSKMTFFLTYIIFNIRKLAANVRNK